MDLSEHRCTDNIATLEFVKEAHAWKCDACKNWLNPATVIEAIRKEVIACRAPSDGETK